MHFTRVKASVLTPVGGFCITALCGGLLLATGGAPAVWLGVQSGAFALALLGLVLMRSASQLHSGPVPTFLALLTVSGLAASLWIDPGLDRVLRWIVIGPVRLHIGQLLLPALVTAHLLVSSKGVTLALVAAIILVALQPDFGTAIGLCCGLLAAAWVRRSPRDWVVLGLAFAAVVVTGLRGDPLLPVPLVEGVLVDSWSWRGWSGPMSLLGAVALPAALVLRAATCRETAATALALAGFWLGLLLASLLGAYPVPLLGYGASAVLGFALALAFLPHMRSPA